MLYDISGATNIAGTAYDTAATPVAPNGVLAASVVPATRAQLVNINDPVQLAKFNLRNGLPDDANNLSEKWEGMALMPAFDPSAPNDVYLFVGNDNDFITTDGFQAGGAYNAGYENDNMVLVYRLSLPTYVDPIALESAQATGVPLVQTLAGQTLGLSRLATRDIGGHLGALRLGHASRPGLSVFASGDWGQLDDDARTGYAGYTADGWVATGGFDYTVNEHVTLGLAFSKLQGEADVMSGWGNVDATGTGFSGFFSISHESLYFAGYFAHNDFDYDLWRSTAAYGLRATASTSGNSKVYGAEVGWRHGFGGFLLNVDGGVDQVSANSFAFTETGAIHLSLQVPDLLPRSNQWHGGVQLAYAMDLGGWQLTPYVAGQYRYETDGGAQPFTLTLANRATVSGASVNGSTPVRDEDFWQGRFGVAGAVGENLGFNIEAMQVFASDDNSQSAMQVSVNYRF
jgi:uncharacterized protein YhjY with autotransporter beta-barrel domain